MNTKKKTILAAAFVVAIIALAGLGYAATWPGYEGKTSTTDVTNTYDIDYVVVKLDDASYATSATPLYITYDEETTWDDGLVKTFTWTGSTSITNTVSFEVPTTNAATDPDTFKLTISAGALTSDLYKLQYKLSDMDDFEDWESGATYYTATTLSNLNSITIEWRIVPDIENIMTTGAAVADPTTLLSTINMPVLTYTVTATQGSS